MFYLISKQVDKELLRRDCLIYGNVEYCNDYYKLIGGDSE